MEDLIVSRLRVLTFILISVYLLSNFFLEGIALISVITAIMYSLIIYYLVSREKLKESTFISVIDLLIIFLYFLTLNDMTTNFLFLFYLPVIKEIIYKREKIAYLLSFTGNIGLLALSLLFKNTPPLEVVISLFPLSFLIPYLSHYYVKEMEVS